MHIQLLNLGFLLQADGTYLHGELRLVVKIVDNDIVVGGVNTTLEELEDAIVHGTMGDF